MMQKNITPTAQPSTMPPYLNLWNEEHLHAFARALLEEFWTTTALPEVEKRVERRIREVEEKPFTTNCTRQEAADLMQTSLVTVHTLMRKGRIRFTKVGRKTIIDKADLIQKLASGELAKYKR